MFIINTNLFFIYFIYKYSLFFFQKRKHIFLIESTHHLMSAFNHELLY